MASNQDESTKPKNSEQNEINASKLDHNRNPLLNDDFYCNDDVDVQIDDEFSARNQNDNSPQNNIRNEFSTSSLMTNYNESIKSLNFWIWQCQTWMYFHSICQQNRIQQQRFQQGQTAGSTASSTTVRRGQQQGSGGVILRVPGIRKRIFASVIDYLFIHFFYEQFCMLVTEVYDLDLPLSFDFKELETFFPEDDDGLEDLLPKLFWIYMKTFQYATLFYLFYLIYETLFLYGWPNRAYPGATLGKRIMGLRVVSCDHLEQISLTDSTLVRVIPAENISLTKAFFRTLLKFLPISNTVQSLSILNSRYNRSYFDSRMGCLVVQVTPVSAVPGQRQNPAEQGQNQNLFAALWQ